MSNFQKRDNEMLRELERANQSTGRSSESQTMGATIDVNLFESEIEVNLSGSESDSAWRIARSAQLTSVCAGIVWSCVETAVAAAAQRSRATEDEPPNQYETNLGALALGGRLQARHLGTCVRRKERGTCARVHVYRQTDG